ncbi:MAG: ABC transporter ATP-binding protein [Acidimicrobiia bacterium]
MTFPGGTAIATDALCRSFGGRLAVDRLTIHTGRGEVLALLGPNGAGKTTTVRLLNGVIRADSGSATVLGLDPAVDGDVLRERTGVLTENAGLDDRLTVLENLVAVGRIRGMSSVDARSRARVLLERFAIADRSNELVQGLSTGQRKRVALARALLHRPDVLFLDEPTSGLDPEATRDVIELIDELATEFGTTIVLCTHFLAEAGRLADRVAVISHGRALAFGTPGEIASRFWSGVQVDLDLGPVPSLGAFGSLRGVRDVHVVDRCVRVTVDDRAGIAELVRTLVGQGIDVYGAVPRPPTLEDVYFAVLAEAAAAA